MKICCRPSRRRGLMSTRLCLDHRSFSCLGVSNIFFGPLLNSSIVTREVGDRDPWSFQNTRISWVSVCKTLRLRFSYGIQTKRNNIRPLISDLYSSSYEPHRVCRKRKWLLTSSCIHDRPMVSSRT